MFGSDRKEWRNAFGEQTLFCRSDLRKVLKYRRNEAIETANRIPAEEIGDIHDKAREIVENFKIPIPEVNWERVKWEQGEKQVDVSRRAEYGFGMMSSGYAAGEYLRDPLMFYIKNHLYYIDFMFICLFHTR